MFTRVLPLLAVLAFVWAGVAAQAQEVTFVPIDATWRLFRAPSNPSPGLTTGWTQRDFADAGWESAPATFFYGETGFQGTDLTGMAGSYSTIFLRRKFNVIDPATITNLILRARCDDGFVAFLNGTRVVSLNATDSDPAFTSTATANAVEPVIFQAWEIPNASARLVAGENVLAVAVMNVALSSSDLVFEAELTGIDLTPSAPVITAVSPVPGLVTNLTRITVTFSEAVTGVAKEHFLINGSPATSMSGSGKVYTFDFPRPAFGLVSISWGTLHNIRDFENPPMPFSITAPGSSWAYELLDPEGPAIVQRLPRASSTLTQLSEVVLGFNRPVTGLEAADLRLNGTPAVEMTGIGAGPYRFRFNPGAAAGTATLSWRDGHGITSDEPVPHAFIGTPWTYTIEPSLPVPDVVIHEILADNQGGLKDEDDDPEDWIELWNRGNTPVNLGGWAITDGADPEDEWMLPPVDLPAKGYLLVWASGKDRPGTGLRKELHTHFKLNPNGGRLRLLGPELPRVTRSDLAFEPQGPDFSFGWTGQGAEAALRYFAAPTPLAANGASSITNRTSEVHFSVERGFYEGAFTLSLACETPGAVIRYTTNGTPPVAPAGFVYTGPIPISASRVIRAAAVAPDRLPSRTQTHTYLVGIPASRRGLPAISLVTATNNLYGRSGIMEFNPRNTSQRGPAWERPVSMEWLDPDTGEDFQVDAGLRIQGGDYIRSLYNYRSSGIPESKYSFRLYFRGEYGQGRLQRRLFPNTTVESFDTIVLRAGMNDATNPFLKDEVIRQLASEIGQPASHGTFVHLFLNGVYRGYYNPTERIDADFLQAYHGGGEKWDIVAQMGEVREGDGQSWTQLLNLAQTRQATNMVNHLEFASRLDLTNFVDYLLPNIYADVDDWPHNNWRAAREAVPGAKWRFYCWDAEWSFGQPNGHSTTFNTINGQLSTLSPQWGTTEIMRLFNALKRGREFQMLFSDRVHRAFFNGGALEDARIRAVYEETKARLNTARTVSGFNNSVINGWINGRRRNVLNHLTSAGFNRSTNAPGFTPFGGPVPPGYALVITNITGAIYYTTDGTDPRVAFTEAVAPTAVRYTQPLVLNEPLHLKVRSLDGTTNWSALSEAVFEVADAGPSIRFSEIMYRPPGGDAFEFIELVNAGGTSVDLSGYSFEGITFRFPVPFPTLAPGARLVLASDENPAQFATRYPGVTVAGNFGGNLSNDGERLALLDREGQVVESVTYSDGPVWPQSADGSGRSLERTDLQADPDAAASWQASALNGGTPGLPNAAPTAPVVHIHEVSAQPEPGADWIELHNPGAALLNLSNWSLTDAPGEPRRFVFPQGTQIAPHGYLVITCHPEGTGTGLVAPFGLGASGEELVLFNSVTNRVDSLAYGPQAAGFTTGRSPTDGSWILCEPTPGSANEPAQVGTPAAVVLNEFSADSNDGDDWVELHNPSALPVSLTGGFLATSNAVFRISAPAFVGAGGFAVFIADEETGPDHVDFKLPAAGGKIEWRTPIGAVVDRVDYRLQVPLVTSGRLPDATGTWTTLPFSASPGASNYLAAPGQLLRIGEFMAINTGAQNAPDGQPADWIELHHVGTNALPTAGFTLSLDDRATWTFPAGSQMAPDARVLVWSTGRALAPGTPNLGIELPNGGGILTLSDERGRLLDQVRFGFQITNRSVGRAPEAWALLSDSTPGQANSVPAVVTDAGQVRINEWLALVEDVGEWIELFNGADAPVDLGGFFITDDPSISGIARYEVPPLSFIPARGYAQFFTGSPNSGLPGILGFSLDRLGETLRFYSPARVMLDQVNFGIQVQNRSEGRFPDGSARIVTLPAPSPLAPNGDDTIDTDLDGIPDTWEVVYGLNPDDARDGFLDNDGDGFNNTEEFVAGTHPGDAASVLVARAEAGPETLIAFRAMPGRSYSVLYLDSALGGGTWKVMTHIEPAGTARDVTIPDAVPGGGDVRLYRVVTPAAR